MRATIITIVCMLAFAAAAQAQDSKAERIKQIRAAYAQAKKKIEQNGKNGKSPKDMTIVVNSVLSEEPEITQVDKVVIYFDESTHEDSEGTPVTTSAPYFISGDWSAYGHIVLSELLLNPTDGALMFCYSKSDTHAGIVSESRCYYDSQGKLIEQKHTSSFSEGDGEIEKRSAQKYLEVFQLLKDNAPQLPSPITQHLSPTTPKAERMKQIRAAYAKAKEQIDKNDKTDACRDIHITIHDEGENWPPRTSDIRIYFDKAPASQGGTEAQGQADNKAGGNQCYFISEHRSSMMFDSYSEYLFDPATGSLMFSYSKGLEEGQKLEWRYYYDENGRCIETKTNAEDTDNGKVDKASAASFIQVFSLLMK